MRRVQTGFWLHVPNIPPLPKLLSNSKILWLSVEWLDVDKYGMVTADAVEKAICDKTALVSVMYANNEIGTINPIKEIAEICHQHGMLFHTDAVQAAAYLDVNVEKIGMDLMSLAGINFMGQKALARCMSVRRRNSFHT